MKGLLWVVAGYLGFQWWNNRHKKPRGEKDPDRTAGLQIDTRPRPSGGGNNIDSPLVKPVDKQYTSINSTNPNMAYSVGGVRRGTSNKNLLQATSHRF